jgi:hypothetical protein
MSGKLGNSLCCNIPDIFRVAVVIFLFTGRLPEKPEKNDADGKPFECM